MWLTSDVRVVALKVNKEIPTHDSRRENSFAGRNIFLCDLKLTVGQNTFCTRRFLLGRFATKGHHGRLESLFSEVDNPLTQTRVNQIYVCDVSRTVFAWVTRSGFEATSWPRNFPKLAARKLTLLDKADGVFGHTLDSSIFATSLLQRLSFCTACHDARKCHSRERFFPVVVLFSNYPFNFCVRSVQIYTGNFTLLVSGWKTNKSRFLEFFSPAMLTAWKLVSRELELSSN